jgi:hypothetical protein
MFRSVLKVTHNELLGARFNGAKHTLCAVFLSQIKKLKNRNEKETKTIPSR